MKKLSVLVLLLGLSFTGMVQAECSVKGKTAAEYINCVITEADCVFAQLEKAKSKKETKGKT